MKNIKVRTITGVAILLAIEIIFQTLGNLIVIGPVNINLSLIPIAIAAIVYGPIAGGFLGLANGIHVILTDGFFMPIAPGGTVLVCLLKCTIAGIVAGLIFRLFAKKNVVLGSIVASLLIPVINTGLFSAGAFTVLRPAIDANYSGPDVMRYVFLGLIGWNFVLEFTVTTALAPAITKIMKIMTRTDKHAL
mgnify:CR=1 FL=1